MRKITKQALLWGENKGNFIKDNKNKYNAIKKAINNLIIKQND